MGAGRRLVQVEAETVVRRDPRTVFDALVEPGLLRAWFADEAELSPRQGGPVSISRGGETATGHVLDIAPARRLLIAWDAVQAGGAVFPGSELEFFVTVRPEGTHVRALHWKLAAAEADRIREELQARLDRLAAFLSRP